MIDAILARRSVRYGFRDEAVDPDVVASIVRAGISAPSSKNAQPWRLHAVTNRDLLAQLADSVQSAKDADTYVPIDPATGRPREWTSTVVESAQVLSSVSLAIFVENCGSFSDGRVTVAAAPKDVRENALVGYGFEMIGLGAAIQTMWLAAEALGLRGVFMGDVLVAERDVQQALGMHGDLVGALALGHTDGEPAVKSLEADRVVWHR